MLHHSDTAKVTDTQRLLVALDVPGKTEAIALVDELSPLGVSFKVGMQLFYKEGMEFVNALKERDSRVFLDLKLHDIPNTVAEASRTLVNQGVDFFNVHATGGAAMMQAAAEAGAEAAKENNAPNPLIIAVTVLTSLSKEALKNDLHVQQSPEDYVLHLAKLTQQSGLSGVVCSAQEASAIRNACGSEFVLVTPGIRPKGSVAGDQSRIMTPSQAIKAGAHFLVVGRPITKSGDPRAMAEAVLDEMLSVSLPS